MLKEWILFALVGSSVGVLPFLDVSMCDVTDTLPACQLKKAQCSVVDTLLTHPNGPVGSVIKCANATGVTLEVPFYTSIGAAFITDQVHTLADSAAGGDSTVAADIRKCTLNSTGLLTEELIINRTAIVDMISKQPIPATLASAIATASFTCAEPIDFNIKTYVDCMKQACMSSVDIPPFIFAGYPGTVGVPPSAIPPSVADVASAINSGSIPAPNPNTLAPTPAPSAPANPSLVDSSILNAVASPMFSKYITALQLGGTVPQGIPLIG